MSIPSESEVYSQLTEHLRKAQEAAAMMAHLRNAGGDPAGRTIAKGWLAISEALKLMIHNIIQLATKGRLN